MRSILLLCDIFLAVVDYDLITPREGAANTPGSTRRSCDWLEWFRSNRNEHWLKSSVPTSTKESTVIVSVHHVATHLLLLCSCRAPKTIPAIHLTMPLMIARYNTSCEAPSLLLPVGHTGHGSWSTILATKSRSIAGWRGRIGITYWSRADRNASYVWLDERVTREAPPHLH